jgi:hypothetical protein
VFLRNGSFRSPKETMSGKNIALQYSSAMLNHFLLTPQLFD